MKFDSQGSYTNVALTPRDQEPTTLPSPVVPPAVKAIASALRRVLRRARDGVALEYR